MCKHANETVHTCACLGLDMMEQARVETKQKDQVLPYLTLPMFDHMSHKSNCSSSNIEPDNKPVSNWYHQSHDSSPKMQNSLPERELKPSISTSRKLTPLEEIVPVETEENERQFPSEQVSSNCRTMQLLEEEDTVMEDRVVDIPHLHQSQMMMATESAGSSNSQICPGMVVEDSRNHPRIPAVSNQQALSVNSTEISNQPNYILNSHLGH